MYYNYIMAIKGLRDLCTPAYIYLVISTIALIIIAIQNIGGTGTYSLGPYTCDVTSTVIIFIVKIIYILFWTWVLNLICDAGASGISWFILLFPFILMFILLASMFL
jgi:hypothetical protein